MAEKEFKINFKGLRKILNSFNLIPGCPEDEFDSLNHSILSLLYSDSDINTISMFLHKELNSIFGMDIEDNNSALEMSGIILKWWKSENIQPPKIEEI